MRCGEENQSTGFTCGMKRPRLLWRGLKLILPAALLWAISVSRVGDPDRRSICCRSPRIEISVRESSTRGGGPVHLHPRVSRGILDLIGSERLPGCSELPRTQVRQNVTY